MSDILIYSTSECPNCRVLKAFLKERGIKFKEMDISTPEALTELSMNGVFTTSAPVLQVGKEFYTSNELFKENKLNQSRLESILNNR